MMDYYSEKKCYRCSGTEIFIDNKRGDVVCQICGEVLSGRIIDDSNEWNIYADDDRSSTDFIARAGRSIKDPIFDCNTTTVGGTNEKRKSLIVSQIKLEGNINHKASKSRDILFRVAGLLHLTPSIQEFAAMLFVKSIKEGVYRSADRTPLAAAVLFISTRVKGYPRLLHEIEEVSSVPIRMINKWQRDICDSFKILLPPFRFFTLIPRIAQKLRMTTAQIEQCRQTCLNIEESKLLDSITPQAVAAAAVLLTCSVSDTFSHQLRRLDTKAIAAVSYTTAKSVQNAFNIISPYADQLSTHLRARCTSSSSSVSASASASASASNGSLANSIEVMAIHTTDDEKGEYKDKGSKETETNTDSSSSGSSGGSSSSRPLSAGRFNMRPRSGSLCSNASITSASIQIKKGKIVDCSLSLDT